MTTPTKQTVDLYRMVMPEHLSQRAEAPENLMMVAMAVWMLAK